MTGWLGAGVRRFSTGARLVRPQNSGEARHVTRKAVGSSVGSWPRTRAISFLAVLPLLVSTLVLVSSPAAEAAPTVLARVNFQSQSAPVPSGYKRDYGQGFDNSRGFGWIEQAKGKALSIVGNGRDRNQVGDQRLDTLIYMQYGGPISGGVRSPARWQYAIASGTYDVTVSVGDPLLNETSNHRLTVDGVVAIRGFKPTTENRFASATVRVKVTDGRLTIDAAGGTNTKINYVEIATPSVEAAPRVVDVDPGAAVTGVSVTTSVTLGLSETVDTNTVGPTTVKLLDPQGALVAGSYNSDGAGSLISFTPTARLQALTTYTVITTAGLLTPSGRAFSPFQSTFTTGSEGIPPAPLNFDRLAVGDVGGPTSLTVGPDGKLYVATAVGQILRYTLGSNGLPTGAPQSFDRWAFQRTILGLRFDPSSGAGNLKLWVSHGELGDNNMPNFTGVVSVLTGADLENGRDVITGLPRSTRDHMTNGIDFGPDGKLYIAQGSMTGYGAPDGFWGLREEVPLSAAILVADVNRDSRFQGTVNVDTSAGYDPRAAGAAVTVFASGTRNPYDAVWHTNGSLFAPVNQSAGGNAPTGPTGSPPPLYDLPAGRDFLARVRAGRYYGHPNPSRGQYVLNGGNPTSAVDPFETPEYPVGQQPDPSWDRPVMDLGLHRSPNGVTQYTSAVFNGALLNKLLLVEFSNGDDVIAVDMDAAGNVGSVSQLAAGLYNPLDLAVNVANGNIYVAEFGRQPDGAGGKVTLLRPVPAANTIVVAKVNFQNGTGPVPPSYQSDHGEAFSAARGYGWIAQDSSTPLSIVGNGRDRNAVADQRLDTFVHMQFSGASGGVAEPARWEYAVPGGTYDVTVSVGDASFFDSTHRITVEGMVAINSFVPSTTNKFAAATVRVNVTDGELTLDAAGGTNTKINYIDVAAVS